MPRERDRSRDRHRDKDRDRVGRGDETDRKTGICKVWMESRGMGFISPEDGGKDYFVHRSQLLDGESLAEGIQVTFVAAVDPMKGTPIAKNCKRVLALAISADPTDPNAPCVPLVGMQTGVVSTWREDNGMGFITPDSGGGKDFFVHRTALLDGRSLIIGSKVAFEPGWDAFRKKPIALRVNGAVASDKEHPPLGMADGSAQVESFEGWGAAPGAATPAVPDWLAAVSPGLDASALLGVTPEQMAALEMLYGGAAQNGGASVFAAPTLSQVDLQDVFDPSIGATPRQLAALEAFSAGTGPAAAAPMMVDAQDVFDPSIGATPRQLAALDSLAGGVASVSSVATPNEVALHNVCNPSMIVAPSQWAALDTLAGCGGASASTAPTFGTGGATNSFFPSHSLLAASSASSQALGSTNSLFPANSLLAASSAGAFEGSGMSACLGGAPVTYGTQSESAGPLRIIEASQPPALPQAAMMPASTAGFGSGVVVEWSEGRGMGFIRSNDGKLPEGDVFVHRSALQNCQSLAVGQAVKYEQSWDNKKNKPCTRSCYLDNGGATEDNRLKAMGTSFLPGTIVNWTEDRGMGFIRCADASQLGGDVYVHRTALKDAESLEVGTACMYLPHWDTTRNKTCTNVVFVKGLPSDGGASFIAAASAAKIAEQQFQSPTLQLTIPQFTMPQVADVEPVDNKDVDPWPHAMPPNLTTSGVIIGSTWKKLCALSCSFAG